MDGPKARVWAYADELDSWHERFCNREKCGSSASPPASDPAPLPVSPHGALSRRGWFGVTLAGAVGATCLVAAAKRVWPEPYLPSGYRVEGRTLTVLGDRERILWRHRFPARPEPDAYTGTYTAQFADVDGDGQQETLFVYGLSGLAMKLICFDSSGRAKWEFVPGHAVVDNERRSFAPPFMISSFVVTSGMVAVSSAHHWSFPCQIALLDGRTGALLSEYWHRGHLRHLALGGVSGKRLPDLLAGGVNDAPEYKQATLVVLDQNGVRGCNRTPDGRPYFQDMDQGAERAAVFFPRTPVSRTEEFNRVRKVSVLGGRIVVEVAEGISEWAPPYVMYELDSSLEVINVGVSDEFVNRYLEQQDRKKTRAEDGSLIAARLKAAVRVLRRG